MCHRSAMRRTDVDGLIYKLKHWPELPAASRTADVFRASSMMSNRTALGRSWTDLLVAITKATLHN